MEHYGIICMGMIFIFNNYSSILKANKNYLGVNKSNKNYLVINKLNNKTSLKQYPKNISSTYK
jgi:hypothetical protein